MEFHDFDEDHLKLVLRDDDEEEDESFRREQPLPFSASTLGASLIRPAESPSLKEPKEDRYKLLPEYAKPNSARGNAAVQVEVIIGEKRVSLSDHEENFLPDGMLTSSNQRINDIIKMTATRSTSFEVLLKLKKADDIEFSFLRSDHKLNPYYLFLRERGGRSDEPVEMEGGKFKNNDKSKGLILEKPFSLSDHERICLPDGMITPSTHQLNDLIKVTAIRSASTPQFEALLKHEQADSIQFDFLRSEHDLNPYYRLLRECRGKIDELIEKGGEKFKHSKEKKDLTLEKPFALSDHERNFLPVGMIIPSTQRINDIIRMTAIRSTSTPQFEVLLKLKQADNPVFLFLRSEHRLNPYYLLLRERRGNIDDPIAEGGQKFENKGDPKGVSLQSSCSSEDEVGGGGIGDLLGMYDSSSDEEGGGTDDIQDHTVTDMNHPDESKSDLLHGEKQNLSIENGIAADEETKFSKVPSSTNHIDDERRAKRLKRAKMMKGHFALKLME